MLYYVMESSKRGIGVLDSNLIEDNWSLGQSLLFTVTVVTTVGKSKNCKIKKSAKFSMAEKLTI